MNLLLVNYGTSNIRSIYNSLKKIKKINIKINDFKFNKYDKIILPGQGHIEHCMKFINENLELKNLIKNKCVLGICIGYHLLFDNSYENKLTKCLSIINDKITKICNNCCYNNFVPNIGWKPVKILKQHDIFKGIPNEFNQYFMHSYSSIFKNQKFSYSISNFNKIKFNSTVIFKNKILLQFHPEKSGYYGLKIIQNFLNL